MNYIDNHIVFCSACNKLRYMGVTTKPDSELCTCLDQYSIPTYNRELTDEELMQATPEEWEFYNNAINGLPTREGFKGNYLDKDNVEIPYGSGPHVVKYFKEAIKISGAHAILEIGFNIGHGAAMLLELGKDVWSIDISEKWETKYAALFLSDKYGHGRLWYYNRKDFPCPAYSIDLAFIDGSHDEKSIIEDILLCKGLGIPYLLFDDWYPRYGETQKAVAKFPELELVKDMNNLRLYTWKKD